MMPPRVPTYHSASLHSRASASFGRSMPLSAASVSAETTVSAEDGAEAGRGRHAPRRPAVGHDVRADEIAAGDLAQRLCCAFDVVGPVAQRARGDGGADGEAARREASRSTFHRLTARIGPRPGDEEDVFVERRRHHVALVVVGVLADQVDAARRAEEPRLARPRPPSTQPAPRHSGQAARRHGRPP